MCIRASGKSLSCVMLALLKVCSRLRALALLSHSQLVVGIAPSQELHILIGGGVGGSGGGGGDNFKV